MSHSHVFVESPIGRLTLVAEHGALVAVHLPATDGAPPATSIESPNDPVLGRARRQLEEYFAGSRTDFDLPLAMGGTEFRRRVWTALRSIAYGSTVSYSDLARDLGKPTATRAVGAANGANPLAIVVPCHRVIGSSGDLVGYAGGLTAKRWLLAHESRRQRGASSSN